MCSRAPPGGGLATHSLEGGFSVRECIFCPKFLLFLKKHFWAPKSQYYHGPVAKHNKRTWTKTIFWQYLNRTFSRAQRENIPTPLTRERFPKSLSRYLFLRRKLKYKFFGFWWKKINFFCLAIFGRPQKWLRVRQRRRPMQLLVLRWAQILDSIILRRMLRHMHSDTHN